MDIGTQSNREATQPPVLAFVHIQKTGGTTLKHILRQSFGPRHCDALIPGDKVTPRWLTPQILERTRCVYPQLQSISGHVIVPFNELAEHVELRFFTFLREPVARTASHFVDFLGHGNKAGLAEYLSIPTNRNRQTRKLCGEENADRAIEVLQRRLGFVGLLERFDESLVLLRAFAGEPSLDIHYRIRNTSADSQLKKQVLAEAGNRDQIMAANEHDLRLYRYVVEEFYLRQVREYGATLAEDVAAFQAANKHHRPRTDVRGGVVRLFLYKPLLPILSCDEPSHRPSANQTTIKVLTRNRRLALVAGAVAILLSVVWLALSTRTLGLMTFVVAAAVFALFLKRHCPKRLAVAWACFFVSMILPIDLTFVDLPGPPRFVPLVTSATAPGNLDQTQQENVFVRRASVVGLEPKWVWVW